MYCTNTSEVLTIKLSILESVVVQSSDCRQPVFVASSSSAGGRVHGSNGVNATSLHSNSLTTLYLLTALLESIELCYQIT